MAETTSDIIYRYILRMFAATGAPPSTEQVAERFSLSDSAAAQAQLDVLEKKGCIYRNPVSKEIVSAYPFSATPTTHQVLFPSGHSVYAMCAIDALGMPAMLDTDADAEIQSVCAHCGASIRIKLEGRQVRVVSPAETLVVYAQGSPDCCAATDQCPFINFFCSADHAEVWQADHSHLTLKMMTLSEALAGGQRVFGNLLRGGEMDLTIL